MRFAAARRIEQEFSRQRFTSRCLEILTARHITRWGNPFMPKLHTYSLRFAVIYGFRLRDHLGDTRVCSVLSTP